jgi:hypothetical protein
MRNASLVMYPVGRFLWGAAACVVQGLVGGVLTLFLLLNQQMYLGPALVSELVLFVATVALVKAWLRTAQRRWLLWDGQNWSWSDDAVGDVLRPVSQMHVQLDFQKAILLRMVSTVTEQGHPRLQEWVWLYKGFAPELWHGIRCAVYSRQR